MRVSTAGRYALRAMLDLALHGQAGPILRNEIAGRQAISAEYIAQLVRQLNQAGLVRSVMGPGGGYLLTRSPAEISVGDILRAVEGPFAAVFCVLQANNANTTAASSEKICTRVEHCAAHILWQRLTGVIEDYLNSVTLQDLRLLAHQIEQTTSDPVDALLQPLPTSETPACVSAA